MRVRSNELERRNVQHVNYARGLVQNKIPNLSSQLHSLHRNLDRGSIASECIDIHRNPRIFKWISIKAWIIKY